MIGAGATGIYELSPIITGLVIGSLWQILVLFGLHWGIIPVALLNIGTLGSDPIMSLSFGASFAQIGAVLAVLIKTKNRKFKALSVPAFISGIFGVTEPAIYGLTLPLKKPFIMSCIAGGIGGALLGYAGSKFYILGGLGVFGYPNFVNKETGIDFSFYMSLVATSIAFIVGFILTYFVGFKDPIETPATEESKRETESNLNQKYEIASPMAGEVVKLKQIKDETFAGEHISTRSPFLTKALKC
ncbi:PTS transporter subunit EIIC [Paenibacillus kribbensis]|uniref:PTS transporter subunit EIIC n=1 Tax=Paenibacillus kribbensis TaxID=172713 RepID=UPI000B25873F